jgi:hypothetical protein
MPWSAIANLDNEPVPQQMDEVAPNHMKYNPDTPLEDAIFVSLEELDTTLLRQI